MGHTKFYYVLKNEYFQRMWKYIKTKDEEEERSTHCKVVNQKI